MNNKQFLKKFGEISETNGFTGAFGGWYKISNECIAILELQKSHFGNYYQLLIKIFIQGAFGENYTPSKELIKSPMGHVTGNETPEFQDVLDFDEPMEDILRLDRLSQLFTKQIIPFTNRGLYLKGIEKMSETNEIYLLPTVREELDSLLLNH